MSEYQYPNGDFLQKPETYWLEERIKDLEDMIIKLEGKIFNLQKGQRMDNPFLHKDLEQPHPGSLQYQAKKQPYRCPVCDGSGNVYANCTIGVTLNVVRCHACEGKGIVWG